MDLSHATGPSRPILDLGSQPQARPTWSQIDNGPWHIGIAPRIGTHAVRVRQSEYFSDAICIDEIFGIHLRRHPGSLNRSTSRFEDVSLTP